MSQSASIAPAGVPAGRAHQLTPRDLDMVRLLDVTGGLTAVDLALAEARDVSRSRRRLRALEHYGLARRVAPWAGEPPLFLPTRAGLVLAHGRDDLTEPALSAGTYAHQRALGHALAQLQAAGVVTAGERLIRRLHRDTETTQPWRLAVGGTSHLPDALYWPTGYDPTDPGRGSVALEIELSRKGGPRVRSILNAYELHHRIERVLYLAAPPALPALRKAIAGGCGGGKATVLPLTDECPSLGRGGQPAAGEPAAGPAG